MTDKDFEDLKKKVEELERRLDKQRISNIANSVSEIVATIDTGSWTTGNATALGDLIDNFNLLRGNIRGQ